MVVAKAAQAIQLVNDMVDVNNVDQGRFRLFIAPVDLVTLVREEVEAAQGLSAQHTIALHTPFDALEIAADSHRLRQVLDNLLQCNSLLARWRHDRCASHHGPDRRRYPTQRPRTGCRRRCC